MRKTLKKGSAEAKAFMAKLRAKKRTVKKTVKRVAKNAVKSFKDGYNGVGNSDVESEIKKVLSKMKRDKKYIALSLQPPVGYSTIQRKGNRFFINEGRGGKFDNVSESFYDSIVDKYDSRIGSTLLIEKGENPRKKPTRVVQVNRTKKGTFKKFKSVSGVKKHTDTKSHNIRISVGALPTYKDEDAAREIQLYADNDSQLYYQRRKPILINLSKKHKKGQYNIDKAAKLWRYYIDAAMQKYHKEFGSRGSKWSSLLSVSDRNILAHDYAVNTLEEFELGNYTEK